MGVRRAREINVELKQINNIFNKIGSEFKKEREKMHLKGRADRTMVKAQNYMEQFMEVMEKYSHLENYDVLMKYINSIKNPFQFYKRAKWIIQNVDENAGDLKVQYLKNHQQQEFNYFVSVWTGIPEENLKDTEVSEILYKDYFD